MEDVFVAVWFVIISGKVIGGPGSAMEELQRQELQWRFCPRGDQRGGGTVDCGLTVLGMREGDLDSL